MRHSSPTPEPQVAPNPNASSAGGEKLITASGVGVSQLKHNDEMPILQDIVQKSNASQQVQKTSRQPMPQHSKQDNVVNRSSANEQQGISAINKPITDGSESDVRVMDKPNISTDDANGINHADNQAAVDDAQQNTNLKSVTQSDSVAKNSTESVKHDKSGKLQFSTNDSTPTKPKPRKLAKAERQAERAGSKLKKAKNKLPGKRKLRAERVFDEQTGKGKTRLYFEKEAKSQSQHLKGSLPLRPVKAAANFAVLNVHRKIYQAEHDNVAVKAAHRGELAAEVGVRSALRFHKTVPYRKVAKLEKKAIRKSARACCHY